ncbi:hypothetical protein BDZ45DRAFT_692538 [Acephala macrosclerotiorum]|nr:hypothetical protein BDZ45DRAFT_692538 [Acephala macrosclerotiorum]
MQAFAHNQSSGLIPNPANTWMNPKVVKLEELCVGSIPFLPRKEQWNVDIFCVRDHHCNGRVLPLQAWNRPFVILRIVQREGSQVPGDLMCDCAEVTTFQKTSPQNHSTFQNLTKFRESVLIQQPGAPPVPDPYLTLENGQLMGPSKFDSTAWGVRLSEASYNFLMARFSMMPQQYEDIGTLHKALQWKMAKALLPGLDFTSPLILLSTRIDHNHLLESTSESNFELENGQKDNDKKNTVGDGLFYHSAEITTVVTSQPYRSLNPMAPEFEFGSSYE